MLRINMITISVFVLSFCVMAFAQSDVDIHKTVDKMHWNGQASWRIELGEQNIYIDPLMLPENSPKADIIFITHSHGDHLSPSDIKSITQKNTILVGPKNCADKLKSTGITDIHLVNPGDTTKIGAIPVEVVPAYNIKKTNYHPKENNFVGYILNIDGVKIYHSGDTERIPEMKSFNCDIALIPLGQTYTMDSVQEAVDAIRDINPKIAIPMHYDMYEGKVEDAQEFKKLLKGKIEVVVK